MDLLQTARPRGLELLGDAFARAQRLVIKVGAGIEVVVGQCLHGHLTRSRIDLREGLLALVQFAGGDGAVGGPGAVANNLAVFFDHGMINPVR